MFELHNLLPAPRIPLVMLGRDISELESEIEPSVSEDPTRSEAPWALEYRLKNPSHLILIEALEDEVHSVVYNTSTYRRFALQRRKKLLWLLDAHTGDSAWEFVLDNGFGLTWNREDKLAQARYSYVADIFSVLSTRYLDLEVSHRMGNSE